MSTGFHGCLSNYSASRPKQRRCLILFSHNFGKFYEIGRPTMCSMWSVQVIVAIVGLHHVCEYNNIIGATFQVHRLHRAGGPARAPPPFYKRLRTGGAPSVEEQQTRNLTNCTLISRKRSPKRLIVLLEPKKWRGTTIIFPRQTAAPSRP